MAEIKEICEFELTHGLVSVAECVITNELLFF
jgi:hypothetical protein